MQWLTQFIDAHLLSILIFLPLGSALFLTLVPERPEATRVKRAAFAITLLEFLLSLRLLSLVNPDEGLKIFELAPWIPSWGAFYRLGIDSLGLYLILLTALLFPISCLVSGSLKTRAKEFFILLLVLEATIMGAFVSLDLLLFYVFWEAMLIPMFLLIGIWGGKSRVKTSAKFFLFTMTGSFLLLAGILLLQQLNDGVLDLITLAEIPVSKAAQNLLFVLFTSAFLVKVPAFPVHSWLPDTHTEAPTAGSVILAAILLKVGVYGILRFSFPLFPEAVLYFHTPMMAIGAIGVVYGSLLSWVQTDIKRLVAYSSIAHMGTVLLGTFSLEPTAMAGAYFHMISHGLTTGGLFLGIGLLYERTHTRDMGAYGGAAKRMPVLAAIFLLITLGSIGAPGTNGFIGEFLALAGTFQVNPPLAITGALGVVLGAVYMLRLYQKIFLGEASATVTAIPTDLNARETLLFVPLIFLILALGVYPAPLLNGILPACLHLIQGIPLP